MCGKLQGVDGMTWVLLAVVTLYISMVNPSNTPAFFSNTAFKFVLFAFVAVVFVLEGPLVGTMFAIAMALPVIYSSLREGYENPFIENYADDDANEVDDSHDDEDKDGDEEKGDDANGGQDAHTDSKPTDAKAKQDHDNDKDHDDHASPSSKKSNNKDTDKDEPEGSPPVTETWCNYANVF